MQVIDMTAKVEKIIRYALAGVLVTAMIIGYAEFKYWHKDETIQLNDAKVVGTMVSVRVLTNGKVKERLFEDGAEVKAGDVIARLAVNITEEEIQQLENTVQLAKDNYATLQEGQWVKVAVQRERVIQPPPVITSSAPSGNVDKLRERAERMAELFEMGAVSAVQRDAARRAYESALANSQTSQYSQAEPRIEYYTEYVDEFRPTPPEVLAGAEQAIKQAELSLNVAKQEARETDVIAPVSGAIYYGVEIEQDLSPGD
ncbi:MAG: biotin/lipoyl-binding protein, partial [Selenomonadaceae bacterium]|nr:biotin/lipoyl-binding protein [Selenomonadaceae bacterium]